MKKFCLFCIIALSGLSCTEQTGTGPDTYDRSSCLVDYHLPINRGYWYATSQPLAIDTSLSERAHVGGRPIAVRITRHGWGQLQNPGS